MGRAFLAGWASWYANGPGFFAAAGPELRRDVGSAWRDSSVVVTGVGTGQARSVSLPLTDWCRCTGSADRLIDLSVAAFERVCGPLSLGICRVEVQWP